MYFVGLVLWQCVIMVMVAASFLFPPLVTLCCSLCVQPCRLHQAPPCKPVNLVSSVHSDGSLSHIMNLMLNSFSNCIIIYQYPVFPVTVIINTHFLLLIPTFCSSCYSNARFEVIISKETFLCI